MGWDRHELLWNNAGWDRKICPMNKPGNYYSRYFSIISNVSLQITLTETFSQNNSGLRQFSNNTV